jgi:hypothetical protein
MKKLCLADILPPLRYFEMKLLRERDSFCAENNVRGVVRITVKKKKVIDRGHN